MGEQITTIPCEHMQNLQKYLPNYNMELLLVTRGSARVDVACSKCNARITLIDGPPANNAVTNTLEYVKGMLKSGRATPGEVEAGINLIDKILGRNGDG